MAEDKPTADAQTPSARSAPAPAKPRQGVPKSNVGPAKKKLITKKRPMPSQKPTRPGALRDKLVKVHMHDEFRRDRAFQMMLILAFTAIVFSLYVFILYYRFSHRPKPVYFEAQNTVFMSTVVGPRMIKPVPLDQARIETSQLFIWVNQSLSDVLSFNFKNIDEHLEQMKQYFTDEGWKEFEKSMVEIKLIDLVKRGRFIVNARASSPPRLERQGVFQNRFEWHFTVDIYVRYRSSETDNRQRWSIKVIVVRAPVTSQQPRGVAIDYFKVESARASI